jgi:predicted nucleic acid-binding protein
MGQIEYLIDTNIAIAYLDKELPYTGYNFVGNLPIILSVITRIELLGWFKAPQNTISRLKNYINNAFIYPLEEPVILKTIELRQLYKIKTPDAVIAATTLLNGLTLLTRNLSDFRQIPDLKITNPFEM